jgi:23S rRNA pseudouridine955/2504/2580 synthase
MGVVTRKVIGDEEGMRLDRWFKTHYPSLAFGHLQKLLRTGQVRVDGGRAKTNTRLSAGQSVRVPPLSKSEPGKAEPGKNSQRSYEPRERRERSEPPSAKGTKQSDAEFLKSITLYEDKEVLVLNKPFGLAVQGGSGTVRHVDGILEAYRDKNGVKPRLVHRLDKDTAGVLLVAKTRLAASTLAKTFRSRSARKIYWALVAGVPKPKQGRISSYLAKGGGQDGEKMRIAKHGDKDASHALTYYAVVEQAAQKLAWLSLKPVTGRTHQLRAHAEAIGHPIVGDPKYLNEDWQLPAGLQNRLHLLARRLVIPHMQQTWNLIGFDTSRYDPIESAPEE